MNNSLLERDRNAIWHPFTPLEGGNDPLVITSAKGVYLHTEDGRKIIDAISSWWVNIHGHSNEHIAKAAAKQALNLEHVIFAGFTHEPAIKLAESLLKILPSNQNKIFYSDNGSTAVEVALKIAFQYWFNHGIEKTKVIAFEGAYHGDTFGAMSVGERGTFTAPFNPYLFKVDFIEFPTVENEDSVFDRFSKLVDTGEVASFIFEPLIQGAAGMRTYSPQFLDALIAKAKSKGILCIADEVMTGFGRTGKLFASDYLSNKPDIFCLSKGITGGTLPLSVTSCSEEVVFAFKSREILKTFFHGHSYTANPISCAVANASMELLLKVECTNNIKRIESKHIEFKERVVANPKIKNIRSIGTIIALELNSRNSTSYFNEIRNKIYPYFLEKNILLRPLGNVIYILPPYIISDDELDLIYKAIEDFLNYQL